MPDLPMHGLSMHGLPMPGLPMPGLSAVCLSGRDYPSTSAGKSRAFAAVLLAMAGTTTGWPGWLAVPYLFLST